MRLAIAVLACAGLLTACATDGTAPAPVEPAGDARAALSAQARDELARDLSRLQDELRVITPSAPIAGPLSSYQEFATATRGGAIFSSPTERASVVTTIYPGVVMGLSGRKVGSFVEIGYEYFGQVLQGWVLPDVVGLTQGYVQAPRTAAEKHALYNRILAKVDDLRNKWKDNPFVSISGFSINVDDKPSVNVDIQYR